MVIPRAFSSGACKDMRSEQQQLSNVSWTGIVLTLATQPVRSAELLSSLRADANDMQVESVKRQTLSIWS
jgi:hypothetical protein